MTVRNYKSFQPNPSLKNTVLVIWGVDGDLIATGDTTNAWSAADYADKTVQAWSPTWGGGSVTLQGSNDPRVLTDSVNAVWGTLYDVDGNAITFSANGGPKVIRENPYFIRVLPAGTLTAVTLAITGKRVR